ncbi:DUF2339 domain-containing protein [Gemmobacter serpentinus]|uniref:DUF2339 domain-containing protein n=1 Tax=Gemmobacter serpentinus TaxID=2652247 RepID=UPI00124E52A8|nr:DUF2339 domain-containing protein [Gemmobacter serpentinus]
MGDDFLIFMAFLIGVAALIAPILCIILFAQLSGAKSRISQLENISGQLVAEVKRLRDLALLPGAAPVARPAPPPAGGPRAAPAPVAALMPAPDAVPSRPAAPPPAAIPAPRPAVPHTAPGQDQPLVFRTDRLEAVFAWLRDNWAYAVAALSLALAGVFFVQYGIEKGLLPPPLHVMAAIAFGAGLIGAGEWLRRRWGDGAKARAGYLPSVFSGAGIVAIFAGIAAGRLIYGLYGPGMTFAGLGLTALGAIWLGWRHGPFLAAIGLLGGALTPFLLDGGGAAPTWLLGYYVGLAVIGLAVDAIRRWAWISVLALVLAHLGLFLMTASGAGQAGWMWSLLAMALIAIIIPQRSLVPDHPAPSVTRAMWRRAGRWPSFPVRLAAGNMVVVTAALTMLGLGGDLAMLGFLLLTALALVLLLWADAAPGLRDLAALPALGLLAKLALAQDMRMTFQMQDILRRAPESGAPATVLLLLALAVLISAGFAWRALRRGSLPDALLAVLTAPVAVLLLEALWQPATVLGSYAWALHVMAVAAAAVGLALAFARADAHADRAPGRRVAWATLAALTLIALSLFLVTSAAALTLALAVLLLVAVELDRRFGLPEMGWFIQAAAAVLSWRLVVDPGLSWAEAAPLWAVLASYLGVAAACWLGLRGLRASRLLPRAVMESLGLSALALLVNVLVLRQFEAVTLPDGNWSPDLSESHWGATLYALPWLILALGQCWRARVSPGLARRIRLLIAAGAGLLAFGGLAMAVLVLNPIFAGWADDPRGWVRGPIVLNSLFIAYAVPGLILLLVPPRLMALPHRLRQGLRLVGVGFLVIYGIAAIRHGWHGRWIGGPEVLQGELYSYTLAMMLTGAGLLWQALARRSVLLRRIAMAVIALTVAKVFLWDVSGLSGLVRVLSFAGLGLALAGLAWLNRWIGQQMGEPPSEPGNRV